MSSFVISGGRPLRGTVCAGGSKNAALPIIFATVAMRGISVIENVPDISDVDTAILMIENLGAKIERSGSRLTVDTRRLSYKDPDESLCRAIRASTYLIGAELARFGKTRISCFGGCNFEPRPIDLHLFAMESIGAEIDGDSVYLNYPKDSEIAFKKISVGATANALILAAALPVVTRIQGHAKEPHIKALADFLISAGAKIEFDEEKITVEGRELIGGKAFIPPDPVETGTYALLSLISGGEVTVCGADEWELSSLLEPLSNAGVTVCSEGGITLFGEIKRPISFVAEPYPGLPTDLQPLIAPTLGAFWGGRIRDLVFPGRYGYLSELSFFGLSSSVKNGTIEIEPSRFHASRARAPDLRGGAALLFPALVSEGESIIENAELVKRGYGGVVEKLRSLGAQIYEI